MVWCSQPFLIGWEPLYNKLIHEANRRSDGRYRLSKPRVSQHTVPGPTPIMCHLIVGVWIMPVSIFSDVLISRFHCTSINNIHVKKFFTSHTIIGSINKILRGAHCIEIDRETLNIYFIVVYMNVAV